MTSTSEILGFSAAALAVAAASLTAFGRRQRRYDGWRWWVVALWLTTLGAAVGAVFGGSFGVALAGLLLMQWPLVTLIGLRRFHPRQALPGSEKQDGAVLFAALVVAADENVAARVVSAPMVEMRASVPNRPLLLALLQPMLA